MKAVLTSLMLGALCAQAALDWKQSEVILKVQPAQVAAEAVFPFANTGSEPVVVSDVILSCGCLSAQPLKKVYAPGEQDELKVRFDLRNRTGRQSKTVQVVTDDGQRISLAIKADIPTLYEIKPILVVWERADAEDRKSIQLINPNKTPIKLLSISSSHEMLPAELVTIREGFEYEVVVARKPGAINARSVIRIDTEVPEGFEESKGIKLYAFAK